MNHDFQRSSSQQGKAYEEIVQTYLRDNGWTIVGTNVRVEGFEIDIVADAPGGVRWWIECKGSFRGAIPGCKRSDTVKKAVAGAWYFNLLPQRCPHMLATSHLPNPGTGSEKILDKALAAGLFDEILVIPFTVD